MVEREKLEALLCSDEGPEQGLAVVETLRDEVPREELLVRVTVHGPPFDAHSVRDEYEGFRKAYKLTLGRFEPILNGVYRPHRTAERIRLVLGLLALAPDDLEVRHETVVCIDARDGVIDGSALVSAFPRLQSLELARCELDDWDALSALPLQELRLHNCRRFDATAPLSCVRLGTNETSIPEGQSFGAVTHLISRGGVHPDALREFQSLRSIRCLGGSGCSNALLEAMAVLPELEVIDVEGTLRSTARGGRPGEYVGADLAVFAETPKLRELRLLRTHIDPHRLHRLVNHPSLRILQIEGKWKKRIPKEVRRELPLV